MDFYYGGFYPGHVWASDINAAAQQAVAQTAQQSALDATQQAALDAAQQAAIREAQRAATEAAAAEERARKEAEERAAAEAAQRENEEPPTFEPVIIQPEPQGEEVSPPATPGESAPMDPNTPYQGHISKITEVKEDLVKIQEKNNIEYAKAQQEVIRACDALIKEPEDGFPVERVRALKRLAEQDSKLKIFSDEVTGKSTLLGWGEGILEAILDPQSHSAKDLTAYTASVFDSVRNSEPDKATLYELRHEIQRNNETLKQWQKEYNPKMLNAEQHKAALKKIIDENIEHRKNLGDIWAKHHATVPPKLDDYPLTISEQFHRTLGVTPEYAAEVSKSGNVKALARSSVRKMTGIQAFGLGATLAGFVIDAFESREDLERALTSDGWNLAAKAEHFKENVGQKTWDKINTDGIDAVILAGDIAASAALTPLGGVLVGGLLHTAGAFLKTAYYAREYGDSVDFGKTFWENMKFGNHEPFILKQDTEFADPDAYLNGYVQNVMLQGGVQEIMLQGYVQEVMLQGYVQDVNYVTNLSNHAVINTNITGDANFITNYALGTKINSASGSDTINNSYGSDVTIDSGANADTICNYGGQNVRINGGDGNDSIVNATKPPDLPDPVVYVDETPPTLDDDTDYGNENNSAGSHLISEGLDDDDYFNESADVDTDTAPDNATLLGGKGDDYLGNDGAKSFVSGGDNADTIYNSGESSTLLGGNGNDSIHNEGNYFYGWYNGKNVSISGGSGDDTISNCEADNVTIDGGKGDNLITSTAAKNVSIAGGADNDTIYNGAIYGYGSGTVGAYTLSPDNVTINALGGNDVITNQGDNVKIFGGAGNDSIANVIWREWTGRIIVSPDNVTISTGAGDDTVTNEGENTVFIFSGGNDVIEGFNDTSTLQLGDGNVKYSWATDDKNIVVTTADGTVILTNATSLKTLNILGEEQSSAILTLTDGDAAKQTLDAKIIAADATARKQAIRMTGNALDNSILGGAGKDTIYGKNGDDSILGNAGADKIYGQNGNDTLNGGTGSDTLDGGNGKDYILGGKGNDYLTSGAGDDSLWGGSGNDTLTGGAGVDTFIYNPNEGKTTITDYQSGELVMIMDSGFTNAAFASNTLTLTIDGGGSVVFKNVTRSTDFNINGTTYHVSGKTIK